MENREGSRRPLSRLLPTRAGISARWHASWLHLVTATTLVVLSFVQSVGRTTFDTKFDLTADPARALGRSFTLWGTQIDFGGLANQGYGYLFPQGTFFLLGDLAALPDWIVQRSWSAVVLLLAYDGARRLARALGVGSSSVPVVVGLVYALSPRIIGLSGVLSAEMLPSAVLPWVCLPLVLALSGRMSARRAALLSGLAVVAMGGVNAAENLAALPLPLFLVASGLRSAAGRRLALWWAGCTAAACLWWMLPLLFLGKYSPPFLDYIETAATTTRTAGWSTTIRGAEHWLGYIVVGPEQWWPAAHAMSAAPFLVVLGGLIAAVGVLGLTRRSTPFRAAFLLSLVVGMVAATAGHGGPAGSPFAATVRDLLNGSLVPFRNVHKVDPLVRLPLAIGVGVVCAGLAAAVAADRRRRRETAPLRRQGAGLVAVVLVLASAAPVFAGTMMRHPGWDEVPVAWQQAATWLDHDGPGATLVLPASGTGQQNWGWTIDEPIQGLASSGWVTRSQIPLVPPTTIRFLDGLESRLVDGSGSAALAPTLAAAGVTRILVRNDLDTAAADTADPHRVAAALANSPGLTPVSSFPTVGPGQLPTIQIYRVDGATGTPTAVGDVPVLTGAPEDVITAREAGVLAPDGHVRVGLAGDGAEPDVVTDGYRLVERTFGRFHDAVGQVRSPSDPLRTTRKVVDFAGVPGVPRTYATYGEATSVVATSSSGYADSLGPIRPELGPGSLLDGDPGTAWRSAPFGRAVGQQLTVDLAAPHPIGQVQVDTSTDPALGVPITGLRIDAGDQSRELVPDADGVVRADFTGTSATTVKVTVTAVDSDDPASQVAIREISLAGIDTTRRFVVPDVGAGARTSFVFATTPPRRACDGGPLGRVCNLDDARPGVEQGALNRDFTAADGGSWEVRGQAVALSSTATARLLLPLGKAMAATTTSVFGGDPSVSGMFAVDGDPATSWLASAGDLAPELTVSWKTSRTFDRLEVAASPIPAQAPYRARIEAGGQTREVRLGSGGLGFFDPITARSARITLYGRKSDGDRKLPVGVGELRLRGVGGLAKPVPQKLSFTSVCGLGPVLEVNGKTYPTSITGTLGDLVEGRRLSWKSCRGPIPFTPGAQTVGVAATGAFSATSVVLTPTGRTIPDVVTRTITSASPLAPSMRIDVAAGSRAVLLFGQNSNPGWRATLNGKTLQTEVVDGWQQGFVVPAGEGGTVRISYPPGDAYRIALGAGGAAILLLVLLLLLDLRRPAPVREPATAVAAPRRLLTWAGPGSALVLLAVLGGPVAAGAALVAALAVRRTGNGLVGVAGGVLVLASSVAAAFASGTASGTPGTAADLLAALGCGLVAGTLVRRAEAP